MTQIRPDKVIVSRKAKIRLASVYIRSLPVVSSIGIVCNNIDTISTESSPDKLQISPICKNIVVPIISPIHIIYAIRKLSSQPGENCRVRSTNAIIRSNSSSHNGILRKIFQTNAFIINIFAQNLLKRINIILISGHACT